MSTNISEETVASGPHQFYSKAKSTTWLHSAMSLCPHFTAVAISSLNFNFY